MVSSKAAKKTPSYRYRDKKSPIQTIKESNGSNEDSKEYPTKLLYKFKSSKIRTNTKKYPKFLKEMTKKPTQNRIEIKKESLD